MKHKYIATLFCLVGLLLPPIASHAQAQERALLFSKAPSEPFQKVVDTLRNPSMPKVAFDQLTWSTPYFVRIAPRSALFTPTGWLQDGTIAGQKEPMLGTRPFVFLTSPQSLYGRTLLEMFQDIGYEAEDILRYQPNQDMVAIIFRYPDDIRPSPEITDGNLPLDWDKRVYVPLWDNAFSLFHHLAQKATIGPSNTNPPPLVFASDEEKAFALAASPETNARLKNSSYLALQVRGGDDWRYRQLLESKLSLLEHFRGTGRTQNEVLDPKGEQMGIVEFVGPNSSLKALAEVAVIDLGRLTITSPQATAP